MTETSDVGGAAVNGTPQHIPVNMYETGGALVVVAPLPGVMAEDIAVEVGGGSVRITAEMRTAAPKDYLLHEWHYGPYERSVDLPEGFGGEAEASFANGHLALRIARGDGDGARTVVPTSRS